MKKLRKTVSVNRNSVERFGYCPTRECLCYCVSVWYNTMSSNGVVQNNKSVAQHQ